MMMLPRKLALKTHNSKQRIQVFHRHTNQVLRHNPSLLPVSTVLSRILSPCINMSQSKQKDKLIWQWKRAVFLFFKLAYTLTLVEKEYKWRPLINPTPSLLPPVKTWPYLTFVCMCESQEQLLLNAYTDTIRDKLPESRLTHHGHSPVAPVHKVVVAALWSITVSFNFWGWKRKHFFQLHMYLQSSLKNLL